MTNEGIQDRIDDLFERVVDLTPDERDAFLRSACDGDADVLAAVQKLLAAHDRAQQSTDFLADPPEDGRLFAGENPSLHPLVGKRVGPYEVKRWLGGGGFGHVYLAFRSDDYKQKVAVKVLRADVDVNDRILARFELERQLLADLQHENIARLLFGGTLENGRPYIVMEYVKGKPVTEYCDAKRLTIPERLALFRQVCEAVAYAHRYSAIHRDIKPGNILVTDDGTVKLLDFGIAKMVDPVTQRRMVTISDGGMPLTPEYASPEQVRGEGISTASDVYSLGVVLYELLTGRRPYEFRRHTPIEFERVICEEEPRKPSTIVLEPHRVRRDDGTDDIRSTESLAEPRSTDPQKLNRLLVGDLEQIVLMALRKEPQRRYPTVEALIQDLDRFDRGQPIVARPIGRRERAMRWVRRNKTVSALSSAVAMALVVGISVSTYFAADARRHASVAIARAEEALLSKREADAARSEAESVTEFLVSAFESPDPTRDGRSITVAEVIDRATKQLNDDKLPDQSLARAAFLSAIGRAQLGLGLRALAIDSLVKAVELRRREQGTDDHDTLKSMQYLAAAYHDAGRGGEARQLQQQIVTLKRKNLGDQHPDTLTAIDDLGYTLSVIGRGAEAIRLHEQNLVARQKLLGPDHPDTLKTMFHLGLAYYFVGGRLNDAIKEYEKTLATQRERLGPRHFDTVRTMKTLADAYSSAHRLAEAIPLYNDVLAARREMLGANHPHTQGTLGILNTELVALGKVETERQISQLEVGRAHQRPGEDSAIQQLLAQFRRSPLLGGEQGMISERWMVRFYGYVDTDLFALPDNWTAIVQQKPIGELSPDRIDFSWDFDSPAPGVPADFFATVATTQAELASGKYLVETISDDGVRVWIDDQMVINNWGGHRQMLDSAEVTCETGTHEIKIEYFDAGQVATLKFGLYRLREESP